MLVYYGKVLELVAIEKYNEKSYLRIKLSFEQEVELFWKVDSDTAENLKIVSEFDGSHKYRLSLHTTLDTIKKQYISLITRTYRDISDQIYFTCSVDYKNELESIKNLQSMNDLNKLPFLSMNLSAIDEQKNEQDEQKNEHQKEQSKVVIPKRSKNAFKWVSVAMIGVLFFLLFGYTNYSYFNKTSIKNSTITQVEAKTTKVNFKNKKTIDTSVTKIVKADTTIQSSFPYIKMDSSITYSIPEGYVALTFDDGPSKYSVEITNILKKYKVGGTFFFIGMNAKKHPDYVRYVYSNGYSIGSHSMNHVKMSNLSYEKQEDELTQSTQTIKAITNEDVVLFRPPFGALNEQTKDVIHDHQYRAILWNKDPQDWETHDANKILNYVYNNEESGSIILLHESRSTIEALPKIIENLQNRNLNIVSLR